MTCVRLVLLCAPMNDYLTSKRYTMFASKQQSPLLRHVKLQSTLPPGPAKHAPRLPLPRALPRRRHRRRSRGLHRSRLGLSLSFGFGSVRVALAHRGGGCCCGCAGGGAGRSGTDSVRVHVQCCVMHCVVWCRVMPRVGGSSVVRVGVVFTTVASKFIVVVIVVVVIIIRTTNNLCSGRSSLSVRTITIGHCYTRASASASVCTNVNASASASASKVAVPTARTQPGVSLARLFFPPRARLSLALPTERPHSLRLRLCVRVGGRGRLTVTVRG